MRSSVLFTAAFAAVALAGPVFDKRGEVVVTDNEVVYVTQLVTVTEGQVAPAAPTEAPANPYPRKKGFGRGRGRKNRTKTSGYGQAPAPSSAAPVPSSEAPAPAPTSYDQPEPVPTSYGQPEPAPTSYEQPAPPPSSQAPAPAPTGYNPPSTGTATTYQQAVVNHHNYHRANHSSSDLVWSAALAQTAKKIADTCVYAHSMDVDGGNYGQNIAAGVEAKYVSRIISDMFYNSEIGYFESQYGKASPDMSSFSKWGHASQIIWAATTEVGCYTTDCRSSGLTNFNYKSNAYYTVCNYKIAGNMMGAFDKNVGTCLNKPTIDGDYNVDFEAIASASIL